MAQMKESEMLKQIILGSHCGQGGCGWPESRWLDGGEGDLLKKG